MAEQNFKAVVNVRTGERELQRLTAAEIALRDVRRANDLAQRQAQETRDNQRRADIEALQGARSVPELAELVRRLIEHVSLSE